MKYSIYTEKPIRPAMLRFERHKFDLTGNVNKCKTIFRCEIENIKYIAQMYCRTEIQDDFSWEIKNSDGTLLDRLNSYIIKNRRGNFDSYYRTYTIKRAVEQAVAMMRKDAVFDWTFTVDWKSGDFGDSGSCYFPPTGGYVECMHRNGVGAIRRFYIKGKGNARAWMAVDQPENGYITIYNRYGDGASCIYFAEMLSFILKDLNIGEFGFRKLDNIRHEGSAHINGDAAVLYREGLPEISSVVLSLSRLKI